MYRIPSRLVPALLAGSLLATTSGGCSQSSQRGNIPPSAINPEHTVVEIAQSEQQWTGVATTPIGNVFVSYPRWSDNVPLSVAEIVRGEPQAWPNESWNSWDGSGESVADHFVAVQSVYADTEGTLWVLDTGNPQFNGVIEGAARLMAFDVNRREIVSTHTFSTPTIRSNSYLNDVRVDREAGRAYIADSGDGALIIVDLETGEDWRVLEDSPATTSGGAEVVVDGQPWQRDGRRPQVHADSIALDGEYTWLYLKPLTSETLYRIPVEALRGEVDGGTIERQLEAVADVGPTDGLTTDATGFVFTTNLNESGIDRISESGRVDPIVRDQALAWPDSISCHHDALYITTSRIHEGAAPKAPYGLYRVLLTGVCP